MSLNRIEVMIKMVIWINQLLLREQSHDRSMQHNFRMKDNRNCKLKHIRINSQIPYTHFILAYVCTLYMVCLSVSVQNNLFINVLLLETAK